MAPPVSGFPNSRRSFTTRSDDSPAREPAQHRPSWNARGVTTGQRLGVDADDLRRVLLGDHITGAKGYPPILDEVEAAIVSAELGNQPRLPRSRTPSGQRYAVVQPTYCSECGTKMTIAPGWYRCSVAHGAVGG